MLKGVRVLDFSQYYPGPYATLRLADLGAEVIKVESPNGDLCRAPSEVDGKEMYLFRAVNRGKKSIVLDLKDEAGREKVHKLIQESDVVLESFRPGVVNRLGIDYEQVRSLKPDLIYCSISGYGQTGDLSRMGSHDLNYMALSGVLSQLKDNQGTPIAPTFMFADLIGGLTASEAILSALFQRERTGKGAYLEFSLVDALLAMMPNHVLVESATGNVDGNSITGRNKGTISYWIYKTKDHRFVSLAAAEPKFWENFCRAVHKEEWIPAQMTLPEENNPIYREVCECFASRTLEEWYEFSYLVDCCMAPVLEVDELHRHPYHQARGIIQEKWGLRQTYTIPYMGREGWLDRSAPPPQLNEHGEHITDRLAEKADVGHGG